MLAEKVVAKLLTTDAGVAALLTEAPGAAGRIWGGMAPEAMKAPLVIYRKQGATRERILDGTPQAAIVDASVDLLVIAKTYEDLKALGEACRVALVDKCGPDVAATGVNVQNLEVSAEGEDTFNPDLHEYAQLWTFRVVHTESVIP